MNNNEKFYRNGDKYYRSIEDLYKDLGAVNTSLDDMKKLYSDLKSTITLLYYSDANYGQNTVFAEDGLDFRTYRFPVNMFAGRAGIHTDEITGMSEVKYDTGCVLKALFEADGISYSESSSGVNTTVYGVIITAPAEKLETLVQEFTNSVDMSK